MQPTRKLAAILSADAAGYSRLMAGDEAATVQALNDARIVFGERIAAHRGRLVDTAGDSVLAEFPSPVEAVACAVDVQDDLARRNAQLSEQRRMLFRIGVNLGDVIEEAGSLYGDGVNVAARLQALAEPGGICVSGTVFDQIEGKLPLGFKSLGEQQVKNIPKPVRTYAIVDRGAQKVPLSRRKRLAFGLGGVALLAATAAVLVLRPWVPAAPSKGATTDSVLAMPSGPSIAVLPFDNMNGDPKEDYFSDGLTEDIITELARFRELHVLARNMTFQYKNKAVDIPEVGRTLRVAYVLEGSVRRTKDRIRINAQLIDARTGAHVWAERYDRAPKDIFAVQDEITGKVVGAIAGGGLSVLRQAGLEAVQRKDPDQLEAYDLVLSATSVTWYTPPAWAKAKVELERAMALDPGYARARQEYAWLMLLGWRFRLGDTGKTPDEIRREAILSPELDPSNAMAHMTAAIGYYFEHQLEPFEREAMKAFELAPYNAQIFAILGFFFGPPGDWDRAVALVGKAHELNPASAAAWYHSAIFYHRYVNGRYQEGLDIMRQHPNHQLCENQMKFVLAYGQLGEPEKAKPYYARCKADVKDFSPAFMVGLYREWNFDPAQIRLYMDGMAKAGYPCNPPACRLE